MNKHRIRLRPLRRRSLMQKAKRHTPVVAGLTCFVLATCLLLPGLNVGAQGAVPPPTRTPLPTATQPGASPTETPVPPPPTPTPIPPTPTAIPPSPTPVPPTPSPVPPSPTPVPPSPTAVPPSPTAIPPSKTPKPPRNTPTDAPPPAEPKNTPRPDPNCQSLVEGNVTNGNGEHVTGATVSIDGEGWSRTMLTNDAGHYGFGGLCAGAATLNAALPGGQMAAAASVTFNGQEHVQVDLSLGSDAVPTTSPTATGVTNNAADTASEQTPSPEPSMPATGFPGWILVGGALLGASLLLASAGVRWAFAPRKHGRDYD